MLTAQELGWFALAALVLVVTPGPNKLAALALRTAFMDKR